MDVPPLVSRAMEGARRAGFPYSCRPEQGRLLYALAAGADVIGETGTGCGVGLAWLVSGARPGTRFVSVERDAARAAIAEALFATFPVTIVRDDWRAVYRHGPFDLLVLDGGGQAKRPGEEAADPNRLLRPGGTLVIDDLTPSDEWPPRFEGRVDEARLRWLTHRDLDTTELRLAPDLAALVATRRAMRHDA